MMLERMEGRLEHRRGYSSRNVAGGNESSVGADKGVCGGTGDIQVD